MSPRFCLFYAGFTSYAPALYFNQLSLVSLLESYENELVRQCLTQFLKKLPDRKDEFFSHLTTAIDLAKEFDIAILPPPKDHKDYFNWLSHYIETFERQFPMSRIDHYYFLYARKISEIICNMELLKTYVDITLDTDHQVDLTRKVEKCLKDNEYNLFKLRAPAALLSSEPRHTYFNVFYKDLTNGFQPFQEIDYDVLKEKEMKELETKAGTYSNLAMDGFKKCIGLLKELGV